MFNVLIVRVSVVFSFVYRQEITLTRCIKLQLNNSVPKHQYNSLLLKYELHREQIQKKKIAETGFKTPHMQFGFISKLICKSLINNALLKNSTRVPTFVIDIVSIPALNFTSIPCPLFLACCYLFSFFTPDSSYLSILPHISVNSVTCASGIFSKKIYFWNLGLTLDLDIEAVRSSEKLVPTYKTTRCYNTWDHNMKPIIFSNSNIV